MAKQSYKPYENQVKKRIKRLYTELKYRKFRQQSHISSEAPLERLISIKNNLPQVQENKLSCPLLSINGEFILYKPCNMTNNHFHISNIMPRH